MFSFVDLLPIIGTTKGFRIYHTDPFSRIFSSDDGNIAIIEMLFSTSLVALVLSPRHLIIQNTKVSLNESDLVHPESFELMVIFLFYREHPSFAN